jgi:hypothetical protein
MSDLRVGTARLRVADARDEPRARVLLDRALHLADLPDRPGRRLLWRHVDLGVVRPDASPELLARRLADHLRAAAADAVWWLDPAAPHADAVVAPDEPTAAGHLLVALLGGGAVPRWPWRAAVPGWTGGADIAGVLSVLGPAPTEPLRRARVAVALDVVARHHLLEALPALVPLAWWRDTLLALPSVAAPSALPPDPPRSSPPLAAAWERPLRARVAGLASADATSPAVVVTTALSSLALAYAAPALRGGGPALAEATHRLLHALRAPATAGPPPAEPAASAPSAAPPAPRDAPAPAPPPQPTAEASDNAAPSPAPWAAPDLDRTPRTSLGGLLFLLAVLRRLGLDALFDADHAWLERDLGGQVLRRLAERAGLPDDDALRQVLPPDGPVSGDLDAPAAITDLRDADADPRWVVGPHRRALVTGALVVAVRDEGGPPPWPEPAPDAADLFAAAVDAWCLRFLQRTAADVARRPAALLATPTHLDLLLPLDTVDIELRRAGLDLDPGWVPWWGRVVAFHYVAALPA